MGEQKFINPVVEVRCPKTNNTVFKIEREGVRWWLAGYLRGADTDDYVRRLTGDCCPSQEVGSEKHIITYMRPFSLFVRYLLVQLSR